MNVFVTGASGYIGGEIAARLTAGGRRARELLGWMPRRGPGLAAIAEGDF